MPRYSDYHRTVVGYHGTKRATARRIILGEEPFGRSENDDDWLGNGIYFWEYAPQQAWLWARQRQRSKGWDDEIAVVASMIRLGSCFDLLDPENVRALGLFYQGYEQAMMESRRELPINVWSKKRLNCAAFEFAYAGLEAQGDPVDTCRAVFVPTRRADRLWGGSGINPHAHIQICVRNVDCILGTWLVKPIEEAADDPGKVRPEEAVVRDADPSSGDEGPNDDGRGAPAAPRPG